MAELAIGAISLGIQVCEGLVKYCRAVSKRSKDIEDITAQIQALQSTFRALDSVLTRSALVTSSDQMAVASAIACVESCDNGVTELEVFLDSVTGSARNGDVKGTMKDVGRKLAFGFRQDEVASLQQKVQSLTATAELALQTLNL